MSQLDRQRLNDNLLDRLDDVRRRLAGLERVVMAAGSGGVLLLPGLALRVLEESPAPPDAGQVLVYAQIDTGVVYMRAMDDAGTVAQLASWP